MKSITLVLCLIAANLFANGVHKNTLVVKTINTSSNLHWKNNGKEVLIIAAPVSMAENEAVPTKNTDYTASKIFGKGSAIQNGFVVYKGNSNEVVVSGLNINTYYYFSIYEADDNGNFTVPGPPLTVFMCVSIGLYAQMAWKSSDDLSKDVITIERSTNSKNWAEIQNESFSTFSAELPGTNFYDKGPLDGSYFYRVKHTYADGNIIFSEPVNITSYSFSSVFVVSPPETNETKKYFIFSDIPTVITITNSKGETVEKFNFDDKNGYSHMFKDVPDGLYNICGSNSNGILNQKVDIVTR